MNHYVKVQNGVVVDGPKPLSSSESDTPSQNWSSEQMRLHGFFRVDISCDSIKETVDFQNPIITEDSVTYNRIQKPSNLVLSECKHLKRMIIKQNAETIIASKYSVQDQNFVALGIAGNGASNTLKSDVKAVYSALLLAIDQVNQATTPDAINAVKPDWPQI